MLPNFGELGHFDRHCPVDPKDTRSNSVNYNLRRQQRYRNYLEKRSLKKQIEVLKKFLKDSNN